MCAMGCAAHGRESDDYLRGVGGKDDASDESVVGFRETDAQSVERWAARGGGA